MNTEQTSKNIFMYFKLKFGLFIDLLFSGFQSIIFTFILQICDMDNDNVLNDIELNEFQVCYFCYIYVIDVLIYWNPSVTEALPKIKIKIVFFFHGFFCDTNISDFKPSSCLILISSKVIPKIWGWSWKSWVNIILNLPIIWKSVKWFTNRVNWLVSIWWQIIYDLHHCDCHISRNFFKVLVVEQRI